MVSEYRASGLVSLYLSGRKFFLVSSSSHPLSPRFWVVYQMVVIALLELECFMPFHGFGYFDHESVAVQAQDHGVCLVFQC